MGTFPDRACPTKPLRIELSAFLEKRLLRLPLAAVWLASLPFVGIKTDLRQRENFYTFFAQQDDQNCVTRTSVKKERERERERERDGSRSRSLDSRARAHTHTGVASTKVSISLHPAAVD
jgi:hypothetical protein